eukprot:13514802-Alexandrium_andersonii.AAC.1
MSASLVGSEMCIRDRFSPGCHLLGQFLGPCASRPPRAFTALHGAFAGCWAPFCGPAPRRDRLLEGCWS